jgi:glycosyltransferase involved in cell wall biosynthesis
VRILFFYFTEFALTGGVETVVLGLAKGFAQRQCPTAIADLSTQWKPKHLVFGDVPLWSIAGPSFPTGRRPRSWASYLRALWQFEVVCRQFQPDIVHVHFPLGQCLPVVGADVLPHGWRLVTSVHGSDIRVSPQADPRLRVWQNRLFQRSDVVTSVSKGLLVDTIHLYPCVSSKAQVIYNGVEPSWFEPHEKADCGPDKYVLFVGSLHPKKGVDILLRAWSRACHHLPGTQLWLVGEGTDGGSLETLARDLGIGPLVKLLGWKSAAELRSLYHAAQLFVLPSRSEGLGMVLLEAGACGAIRVGTRIPGITEVITDGLTGFLVEPESPEALADAMVRATRLGDEERRRMSGATQESVRTRFTQEIVVSKYLDLYQKLVLRYGSK